MHLVSPLLLWSVACAPRTPRAVVEVPAEQVADVAVTADLVLATEAVAVFAEGIACGPKSCAVLTAEGLHELDPRTLTIGEPQPLPDGGWQALEAGEGGWVLSRPMQDDWEVLHLSTGEHQLACALRPADLEDVFALRTLIRELTQRTIDEQRRTPFLPMVSPPGGGVVMYQIAREEDGAAWVRIGGANTGGAPAAGAVEPPWTHIPLALHPTGREIYGTPWPARTLEVLDPVQLTSRWQIEFEGPVQGLFLDETARLLVVEEGFPEPLDADSPTPTLLTGAMPEPASDRSLRQLPRPPAAHTVVVDLHPGTVAARVLGNYRGLARSPDGAWLLATDRAVARLTARESAD